MNLYYSPAYNKAGHSFDTTRKADWLVNSLYQAGMPGIKLVEPAMLLESTLSLVHDQEYIDAVRTGEPRNLATSQGFTWDEDLFTSALASTSGMVQAASDALLNGGVTGTLSSGLHHASYWNGAGFCTFNGLALAAHLMHAHHGANVLVLDLDAHCGGGTAGLIDTLPGAGQLDISVSAYDLYMPYTERMTLDLISSPREYKRTLEFRLANVIADGKPDLVLYNAGMDPYEGCSVGGLDGMDRAALAAREELVFGWAKANNLPVAFTLAGGYVSPELSRDELVGLHRLTLKAGLA